VTLCFFLAGVRLFAEPLGLNLPLWPRAWTFEWYGHQSESGARRAKIVEDLERRTDKALVIVRYSPNHQPLDEWVYNTSDIESSRIVWAREMDAAENNQLMRFYKDRTVWLVQPDSNQAIISPYPAVVETP
jgi:hypothetical protein